jgi:hypothetical protein
MLQQFEENAQPHRESSAAEITKQKETYGQGSILTPELSAYHRKIIDSAFSLCEKRGPGTKRLIRGFSAGDYSEDDFKITARAVEVSDSGAAPQKRVCTWLLGLPTVRPSDRPKAAAALRSVLLKAPTQHIPSDKRLIGRAMGWTSLIGIPCGLLLSVLAQAFNPFAAIAIAALAALLVSVLLMPFSLLYLHRKEVDAARDLRFIAAHALGRLQAVEAIDAVAAASAEQDAKLREVAMASLRVLMSRLTRDHYGHLGSETVPNLCQLLQFYAAPMRAFDRSLDELNMELLEAVEKIGDARAIAAVTAAAGNPRLADRAINVLEILEERRRRETNRLTLLRGSEPSDDSEHELLRASSSRPESTPEQLLRPIE